MTDAVVVVLSAAVVAAYVCRVDRLSWRWHPWQMLVHVLGGVAAAWVLAAAGEGRAQAWHAVALVCAAALLVVTYGRLPKTVVRGR